MVDLDLGHGVAADAPVVAVTGGGGVVAGGDVTGGAVAGGDVAGGDVGLGAGVVATGAGAGAEAPLDAELVEGAAPPELDDPPETATDPGVLAVEAAEPLPPAGATTDPFFPTVAAVAPAGTGAPGVAGVPGVPGAAGAAGSPGVVAELGTTIPRAANWPWVAAIDWRISAIAALSAAI